MTAKEIELGLALLLGGYVLFKQYTGLWSYIEGPDRKPSNVKFENRPAAEQRLIASIVIQGMLAIPILLGFGIYILVWG